MTDEPGVVELRQYTLVPGGRDTLIELFDTHLVDPQADVGMSVLGQFRDRDDPDRFVWLRGFPSLPARAPALRRFYLGPVWAAHRETANATMVDSDDVLLLAPLHLTGGFPATGGDGALAITVACLDRPVTDDDRQRARTAAGTDPLAVLATFGGVNEFPALPVRDDHALVWITRDGDDVRVPDGARVQRLRLDATSRSRLR